MHNGTPVPVASSSWLNSDYIWYFGEIYFYSDQMSVRAHDVEETQNFKTEISITSN